MIINMTASYVFGNEIVTDTKAVIATNQKRVFVFGGAMKENLENLAHHT